MVARKRDEERRRRNKPVTQTTRLTSYTPLVDQPPLPEDRPYCVTARRWYEALAASPQSQFFEATDWEYAEFVARMITKSLRRNPPAHIIRAAMEGMDHLLTTEGARRKLHIEITRDGSRKGPKIPPAVPSQLFLYRGKVS